MASPRSLVPSHISVKDAKALIGQARQILELARPERVLIGGAIGLLLGSTTISLAVPKVMGGLIDSVMQNTGTERMPVPCMECIFVAAGVYRFVLRLLRERRI